MRNATWSPVASSISALRVRPWPNSSLRDLDHAGAVAAGELLRAVGRAGVDHQELDRPVELLGATAASTSSSSGPPFSTGMRDGQVGAMANL